MHTVGAKYEETKGLSRVEIAKLFRADVKASQKAGQLPASLKLSVRCSQGKSIDVEIARWDGEFLSVASKVEALEDACGVKRHGEWVRPSDAMATELQAAINVMESMLQAYNYDDSDLMTDYFNTRFYGHVKLGWQQTDAAKAAFLAGHADFIGECKAALKNGVETADQIRGRCWSLMNARVADEATELEARWMALCA
jgi:hypothetical protein